ncbi:MAG: DUF2897 family protein [Psychrosphaera sp.]|nr:DUF2897 family protein [Psychrosphaera sp.]
MSNLGITLLIILVLGIIVGNIVLLKHSAKFEIKRDVKTEVKKKKKKKDDDEEDQDDSSW